MIVVRMLGWACALTFLAWATSEAAGKIAPDDYLVWLGAWAVGVVLFGMAVAELGLCVLNADKDEAQEKP
jgi:hypothetical protein